MKKLYLNLEQDPKSRRWNIFTVVMLVATVCLCLYFLMIFANPYSALNFFKPPKEPTVFITPTASATPRQMPPTWTPTDTLVPTPTRTKYPTWTPIATNTLYIIATSTSRYTPTKTPTPSKTLKPTGMPYSVGTPAYLTSSIYHPDAGCSWLGVAGMAVDSKNAPVLYLVVRVTGTLLGAPIDIPTLTGAAPAYGQSGFEIFLTDHPVDSTGTLWIQLFDQAGNALTDKVYLNTYADCNKNLILIRFTKLR